MFCKACGHEMLDSATMCVGCGTPVKQSGEVSKALLVWGWVCAVLLPIVGLILGIVVTVKQRWGHGIGMIVASIFFWFFWIAFFAELTTALY